VGRMKELWQAQQEIRAVEEVARMEAADGTCKEHGRGWIRLDGSCARCTEEREMKQRSETVRRVFPVSGLLSDEEQLGRAAKHELEKRLPPAKNVVTLVEQLRECIDPLALEAADYIESLRPIHPNPADFRYWEGRYRDEKAEVIRLSALLEQIKGLATDSGR